MARKKKDYRGLRVGRLTVVKRLDLEKGVFLLCNCSCGTKEVIVRQENIGKTFSCGCLREELSLERAIDINKKRASKKEAKIKHSNLIIKEKEGNVNE